MTFSLQHKAIASTSPAPQIPTAGAPADGRVFEFSVLAAYAVDRARHAARAAFDVGALETGARRRGGRKKFAVNVQKHFSVRADIHQKIVASGKVCREPARNDIRAEIRRNRWQKDDFFDG